MRPDQIDYIDVDHSQVNLIEELRERFVPFHLSLGTDFPEEYDREAMDRNMKKFLARAGKGAMRIFLARDRISERYVGFCMATLDPEGEGMIESFLVLDECRGSGIGTRLFQNALDWLEARSAVSIKLNVLPRNVRAIRFYERFGFRPLSLIMKRLRKA